MDNNKLLILLAHGSRDPRWQEPFKALTLSLREQLGQQKVALAYMEMAEPGLLDIAEKAIATGVTDFIILPLFMAAGGHVSKDIPLQAERLRQLGNDIKVEVLPPIGEHPLVVDALKTIAKESLQ